MTRRTALLVLAAAPSAALAPLEAEAPIEVDWDRVPIPPVDLNEPQFDSLLDIDADPLGGCWCFKPPPRTPEQRREDIRVLQELLRRVQTRASDEAPA